MKKQRLKNKKEEGITLIALVITIVVMLILAGVTINLTLGENGIFTTAQQAAKNYTEAQEKEQVAIEHFTNIVDKTINSVENNYEILGTIIKTENAINYTADGEGNTIPVPVGFSPIRTKEQGTKDTGFVIKNNIDGNEFVWVPVQGMSYKYDRIAWSRPDWVLSQGANGQDELTNSLKITRAGMDEDTYYWTEKMPIDEKISVEKYGGFYIGRYESGIVNYDKNNIKTSNDSATDETEKQNWTGYTEETGKILKLVVQDNQQVWNYITRNRALTEATNLYNKEANNVTSKLCSSYAWDTALKFIETQNSIYPTKSVGGNYHINSGGTGELQKTGYHAVNNIYDMGGNAWEWTTELYSDNSTACVERGGNFSIYMEAFPAAYRYPLGNTVTDIKGTFRVALYM